jgi:hypothetical protein
MNRGWVASCPKIFTTPSKDSAFSCVSLGECPENPISGAPADEWNYHGSDKASAIAVRGRTGRATR